MIEGIQSRTDEHHEFVKANEHLVPDPISILEEFSSDFGTHPGRDVTFSDDLFYLPFQYGKLYRLRALLQFKLWNAKYSPVLILKYLEHFYQIF